MSYLSVSDCASTLRRMIIITSWNYFLIYRLPAKIQTQEKRTPIARRKSLNSDVMLTG